MVFFFCGSEACTTALGTTVLLCGRLGLRVAPHKVEGPCTVITFLGIEIDSGKQELRLTHDKLSHLKGQLADWTSKRSATKKQLRPLELCRYGGSVRSAIHS